MKTILMSIIVLLSFISSAQAMMSYQSGQYYSQRSNIESVCGGAFVARGNYYNYCAQKCKVAQWYSECGGGYVNMWVCNGYGCSWQSQYSNGCRWAYRWKVQTNEIHNSYCY